MFIHLVAQLSWIFWLLNGDSPVFRRASLCWKRIYVGFFSYFYVYLSLSRSRVVIKLQWTKYGKILSLNIQLSANLMILSLNVAFLSLNFMNNIQSKKLSTDDSLSCSISNCSKKLNGTEIDHGLSLLPLKLFTKYRLMKGSVEM